MYALVLAAMLGYGEEPTKANPTERVALDGNWTVLCLEKDGMPVAEAKDKTVTFRNNTVTYTGEDAKKLKAMRIEFGAKGTVRVTEIAADAKDAAGSDTKPDKDATGSETKPSKDAKTGHYILTKDFLAICMSDPTASRDSEVKPVGGRADTGFEVSQPNVKSALTIILKRANATSPERRP